jgi:hypothetical protein
MKKATKSIEITKSNHKVNQTSSFKNQNYQTTRHIYDIETKTANMMKRDICMKLPTDSNIKKMKSNTKTKTVSMKKKGIMKTKIRKYINESIKNALFKLNSKLNSKFTIMEEQLFMINSSQVSHFPTNLKQYDDVDDLDDSNHNQIKIDSKPLPNIDIIDKGNEDNTTLSKLSNLLKNFENQLKEDFINSSGMLLTISHLVKEMKSNYKFTSDNHQKSKYSDYLSESKFESVDSLDVDELTLEQDWIEQNRNSFYDGDMNSFVTAQSYDKNDYSSSKLTYENNKKSLIIEEITNQTCDAILLHFKSVRKSTVSLLHLIDYVKENIESISTS